MDFASALASVPFVDTRARSRPSQVVSLDRTPAPLHPKPVGQSQSLTGILRTGVAPDTTDLFSIARDSSSDHKSLSRPESLVYADPVTGQPPPGFLTSTERIVPESELSGEPGGARDMRRQAKQELAQQNLEQLTHRL